MSIKRGQPNIQRKHARNFTQESAQKRLDEAVIPFNQQVMNSLFVDSVEIEYYHAHLQTGIPCSCDKHHVGDTDVVDLDDYEHQGIAAPVIPTKDADQSGLTIRMQDEDIFGESFAEKIFNDSDSGIDVSGYDRPVFTEVKREGASENFEDGLLGGGSVNCGICYRVGLQPGYTAYGKQRYLFTNYNVDKVDGYFLNRTRQPHVFERQTTEGWVTFKCMVPKYFRSVLFSVRNNVDVLVGEQLYLVDGRQLSSDDMRYFAGRELHFRIMAPEFTHVVIEFELDVTKLRANLSKEGRALDYDRLETLGDITAILPPTIAKVTPGDVIWVPSRNLALKIRDADRSMTATQRNLEWTASTRVLQPTEALRNIVRGNRLY